MSAMQAGTQMVKLRGGSKGLVRFYFLDEHRSCIRWRPSRKNEKAKSEWGAGAGAPAPGVSGGSGPRTRARPALELCGDLRAQGGTWPGPAAACRSSLGPRAGGGWAEGQEALASGGEMRRPPTRRPRPGAPRAGLRCRELAQAAWV